MKEITKEAIVEANKALSEERHSLLYRSGHSSYVSEGYTDAMLNIDEAKKALSLGIHIGEISAHEDYHGTYEGYYSFASIHDEESLSKYAKSSSLSIDPAYEYDHIGEKAIKLADMKQFVTDELEKDMKKDKEKSIIPIKISTYLAEKLVDFMENYDSSFGYSKEIEGQANKTEWVRTVKEAFLNGKGQAYINNVRELKDKTSKAMKQAALIETELMKIISVETSQEKIQEDVEETAPEV